MVYSVFLLQTNLHLEQAVHFQILVHYMNLQKVKDFHPLRHPYYFQMDSNTLQKKVLVLFLVLALVQILPLLQLLLLALPCHPQRNHPLFPAKPLPLEHYHPLYQNQILQALFLAPQLKLLEFLLQPFLLLLEQLPQRVLRFFLL